MAEGSGLENRRRETYRGFESHPLRHQDIMKFESIKQKNKIDKIKSNVFENDTRVLCEYYKSCQFNGYNRHDDSLSYAAHNCNLIEDAIDLIVTSKSVDDNSLILEMKNISLIDSYNESSDINEIKKDVLDKIKNRWRDIPSIDLDLSIYDSNRSDASVTITVYTTYEKIKCLDDEILSHWYFTFFTPYGVFEVV